MGVLLLFVLATTNLVKTLLFIDGVGGKRYMRGRLQRYFAERHYQVDCFDYLPSRQTLAEIQANIHRFFDRHATTPELYCVGYSFGGVLLRQVLAERPELAVKRVVLLASPTKALSLAERMIDWRSFHWTAGECGQFVANQAAMASVAMPSAPTAAVYGTWPYIGVLSFLRGFKHDHDGMVSVAEACALPVQHAVAIPASHAFIPSNDMALQAMATWFDET